MLLGILKVKVIVKGNEVEKLYKKISPHLENNINSIILCEYKVFRFFWATLYPQKDLSCDSLFISFPII